MRLPILSLLLLLCPLLSLLLSACATTYGPDEYRQSAPAYRPVPRPPALTPGYNPNTYEPPPYAPAGAGASHGGIVTTPGGAQVPRSKGRILPPTSEPGLWAADGAPSASSRAPALFDVLLPYPALAVDAATRERTDMCVETILTAAELEGLMPTISKYPDHVKMCMAARAYALCASTHYGRSEADRQTGGDPVPAEQWRITREHAKTVVEHFCPGSGWDPTTHEGRLAKVMTRWIARLGQYSWKVH